MPVKLSGALIEEARSAAKPMHRSLTGQIEHWASLGRALESQLSGEAVAAFLEKNGGPLKVSQVAESDQRKNLMDILSECLGEAETNPAWLQELSAKGIPLFGTKTGHSEIVRRDPDGTERPVSRPEARKDA